MDPRVFELLGSEGLPFFSLLDSGTITPGVPVHKQQDGSFLIKAGGEADNTQYKIIARPTPKQELPISYKSGIPRLISGILYDPDKGRKVKKGEPTAQQKLNILSSKDIADDKFAVYLPVTVGSHFRIIETFGHVTMVCNTFVVLRLNSSFIAEIKGVRYEITCKKRSAKRKKLRITTTKIE
jgi:hypothetical protein